MKEEKMEDRIRRQLEARRITPSDEAWQKLEHRFDHRKKPKRTRWWVAVVVAFLVGFLGAKYLEIPQAPAAKSSAIANEKASENGENLEKTPALPVENIVSSRERKSSSSTKREKTLPASNLDSATKNRDHPQIRRIESRNTEITSQTKKPSLKAEAADLPGKEDKPSETAVKDLNTTIAGIVEKARSRSRDHEVTDAEIEELLHQAQLKIRAEAALKASKNRVNATVLLREVELDLDKSLKERIFNAIHKGLNQAREMLASRSR